MISLEARERLAAEFDAKKCPWFAIDVRRGVSKQFDTSLRVITAVLMERDAK